MVMCWNVNRSGDLSALVLRGPYLPVVAFALEAKCLMKSEGPSISVE